MSDSIPLHAKFLVGEITEKQYEAIERCEICCGKGEICVDGDWYYCECEGGEKK